MDENANALDKNADSYPAGTIKAYGFKAGDGKYYAVDAEAIPDRQYWGGYGKEISNVLNRTDSSLASQDYAGEQNTIEIITQLNNYSDSHDITGAPAAEACYARTFNGKHGFLPALGQLNDFYSHKSEVDSLVIKFSLNTFQTYGDDYYWTSTQWLDRSSWMLRWSSGDKNGGIRHVWRYVRAFFAL